MEKLIDYKEYFDSIGKQNYFGRLGKVFDTDKNYYFYDMGTGKVARVNYNVYLVLKTLTEDGSFDKLLEIGLPEEDLLKALDEIIIGIEEENILSARPLETMTGAPVLMLEENLNYKLSSLILEVTEKCNLRCKYCIYHPEHKLFRSFGHKDMTFEVAKKAIDFVLKHSSKTEEEVVIGFYGGEPLLNFPLIVKSVEYAKIRANEIGRKIGFAMTTNGTLLNDEIADFLVDNDFNLIISLDGPEELHNENRVYSDGRGSFYNTISGIKTLLKSRKKKNKEMSPLIFNMVVDGEDIIDKYKRIQQFLESNTWLPENLQILVSAIDHGPKECKYIKPQTEEELNLSKDRVDPMIYWSDKVASSESDKLFSKASLEKGLARIHNRLYSEKAVEAYGMNGCCVPGHRRVYVTTDGKMYPCEKVGNIPSIGNVDDGFWFDEIRKHYVQDFIEEAKKYCKDCWAVNLCGLCYTNCYDERGIHYNYRHNSCIEERIYLSNLLTRYHSILEENPEKLKELDDIDIK
jgi:uncharacterized protein